MVKNKHGFTLIELVAVLIIIAIIGLIVSPLVLNIIRKVKESTNRRSVDGYGRAVEYAMANYQLVHLTYPDSIDKLEIDYQGNKVECDTTRINPDYTIYLSKCKVNGKYVKYDKNEDGYYHYGVIKMTDVEYVDTYGKNLETALKKYHAQHNEYPKDYTALDIEKLDKDISCNVSINYDGTVYLESCKVDNETVVDNDDNAYVYGNIYATTELLKKANGIEISNYSNGDIHEMYTFNHEKTEQTPSLIDYRYIGNDPYNYARFNGDETWRIIGIFDVEDSDGNWSKRVKLVRNESIGNKEWDLNNTNEWKASTMQVYLNDEYSLENNSEKLSDNAKYYLGGLNTWTDGETNYQLERGITTIYDERSKNWTGSIGLIYSSDYIYTYALGVDDTCYNDSANCAKGNPTLGWLYKNINNNTFTINPRSKTNYQVISILKNGNVFKDYGATSSFLTFPTLYLKPNVKIKSGNGTSDNPYEFEL